MSFEESGVPALPPPGWYPDPSNHALERWWAGPTWTEHVREIAPPAPAFAPEQHWGIPAAAQPYSPMTSSFGRTYAGPYNPDSDWRAATGSPNTVAIWLLAAYPAFYALIELARLLLPLDASRSLSIPIAVAVFAAQLGCAIWDHFELKQRGLAAASPVWLLLSVIGYMIARRVVLKRNGVTHNAPGNVFAGQILLLLVGGIGLALFAGLMVQ